jgi:hypothetical protein
MSQKFEEFMEKVYVENGHIDMDLFYDWMHQLPIENIIMYADQFAKQQYQYGFTLASNAALKTIREMR